MNCYFCQRNIKEIDYKNTQLLHRFLSGLGKIRARKKTGVCSKHQKMLSRSIKRARHFGLLSYTSK
ncbi:MAG: 30S ribosomal protein S18 [Patescibacteria group bacterium]|nr:30S ribosomal protein S18 [Patescibacteria group bacterium]